MAFYQCVSANLTTAIYLRISVLTTEKHPYLNLFFSTLQGQIPAGGNPAVVTSSSSHVPSQHPPSVSLKGVASGNRSPLEYNACPMKGVYIPSPSPSPYDLSSSSRSQTSMLGDGEVQRENPPVIGGPINTINEKQVLNEAVWPLTDLF